MNKVLYCIIKHVRDILFFSTGCTLMGERLIHKIKQLCLTRLLKNFSHRGIELFVPRQTWVSGKFWLNILKSRKHFWWVLKCCFLVIFTSQRVSVFSFCWENSLESGENSISERLNVKIFLGSMPPDPPQEACAFGAWQCLRPSAGCLLWQLSCLLQNFLTTLGWSTGVVHGPGLHVLYTFSV